MTRKNFFFLLAGQEKSYCTRENRYYYLIYLALKYLLFNSQSTVGERLNCLKYFMYFIY